MYSKPIKLNKTQVLFLPASLVLYLLYIWLLTDLKEPSFFNVSIYFIIILLCGYGYKNTYFIMTC